MAVDVAPPHAATRSDAINVNDVRGYSWCPHTPRDAANVARVFRMVPASFFSRRDPPVGHPAADLIDELRTVWARLVAWQTALTRT
jgi:hypothetical protein